MSQASNLNRRLIEQSITKGTKKVIAASGVIDASTRRGNKELHHLIRRLAQQPFPSLAAATAFGEAVGRKVVEQSQQMGRTYLDQGVIRQLLQQSDLFAGVDRATDASSVQAKSSSSQAEAIATEIPLSTQEDEAAELELDDLSVTASEAEKVESNIEGLDVEKIDEEEIAALTEQGNEAAENFIEAGDEEVENLLEESEGEAVENGEAVEDAIETEEDLEEEIVEPIEAEANLAEETNEEEIAALIENVDEERENSIEDNTAIGAIEALIEEENEEEKLENSIEDEEVAEGEALSVQ